MAPGFGKYQLIAELGHGGMADVFLAVLRGPEGFNKLVVIKRLRSNLVEDREFVAMLMDEARLAARLNHPNVIQTNEVGVFEEQYFIAMEYLEGQPLNRVEHRSAATGGMPQKLHYRVLSDVLCGLHHAHNLADYDGTPLHVVHRDVSPHNVFVTYDGQVKIVDFGIAKAARRSSETRTGVVKGKLTYMAPEQACARSVDRRADIFSVGIMLWEVATRRRMWKDLEDIVIVQRLVDGVIPRSPMEVDPEVPSAIDRICQRALAPNPDDRYATAAEMQADIDAFLMSSGEHVGNAELGSFVLTLFADKRAKIRGIIERQLAHIEAAPSEVAPLSVPTITQSASSSRIPLVKHGDSKTLTGIGTQPYLRPAPRKSKRAALGMLAAGAVAVAAGVVTWKQLATTSTTAQEAAVTEAATVQLDVRAAPADAKLYVDGAPLASNPGKGTFPRDGAAHTLRAEAAGYVVAERTVLFNAPEIHVEFVLDADPPAADAALAPSATARAAVSPGAAAPPRRGRTPPAQPKQEPTAAPQAPPPPAAAVPAEVVPRPTATPPPLDTANPWAKGAVKPLDK